MAEKPRLTQLRSSLAVLGSSVPTLSVHGVRDRSRRFQARRARFLRAHPLCGGRLTGPSPEHSACVRQGRATAATDLDHIVALHQGGEDNEENWQGLCGACHQQKSLEEIKRHRGGM